MYKASNAWQPSVLTSTSYERGEDALAVISRLSQDDIQGSAVSLFIVKSQREPGRFHLGILRS